MPRLATCKGCGKKLQTNERFVHSGKSYCESCYNGVLRESEEYKQLIEFICDNYELDRPTGFILKQIKEFKEFGYTYGGMTYTLWYCKEMLGKSFDKKYGVSLIKYYYEEAEQFYIQQDKLTQQMKKLKDTKVKTNVVKLNKVSKNKSKGFNNSLIDIENLIQG